MRKYWICNFFEWGEQLKWMSKGASLSVGNLFRVGCPSSYQKTPGDDQGASDKDLRPKLKLELE
jgi:hypothetical protein